MDKPAVEERALILMFPSLIAWFGGGQFSGKPVAKNKIHCKDYDTLPYNTRNLCNYLQGILSIHIRFVERLRLPLFVATRSVTAPGHRCECPLSRYLVSESVAEKIRRLRRKNEPIKLAHCGVTDADRQSEKQ
ncbi:hypothetical protein NEUTE2DRAFT_123463 [Neurospora tetrasperma FGSC 2509]|nr:hypothetical protein NEUTE2DRAFT_123463 [Neurospora tetrasperma FGSC 2509]